VKRLILALTALAGVGCGGPDRPPETAQTKQAWRENMRQLREKYNLDAQGEPKVAVGKAIPFPSLIATDDIGRRWAICEFAQRIVRETQLSLPAAGKFPDCTKDYQSQVEDLGDGRYAINSWVEIAAVRTAYSGDAVITEVGGEPRTIRIIRLDLEERKTQ
jgi:hypothetical protein